MIDRDATRYAVGMLAAPFDDAAELWLFSYGTLRQPEVQRALFGREVECVDDDLLGYVVRMLTITDAEVVRTSGSDCHPVLDRGPPDARVRGSALRVTSAELEAADRYEVSDYERVPVGLASGRRAFVYVRRAGGPA